MNRKRFCKKVPEVDAPWKFRGKHFYKQLLEMNETLNVTQFQDEISKYIKNCQQLKQRSGIPLLAPTKPQANWESHTVLFHWLPNQVSEKQSTDSLCYYEHFGGWDHILHSTVLRGDGWGKTLPGIPYTLQLNQFAYNKYCLTLGEPLNGPESLFAPPLTGKSSVSLTEFVKRGTRDLGPSSTGPPSLGVKAQLYGFSLRQHAFSESHS